MRQGGSLALEVAQASVRPRRIGQPILDSLADVADLCVNGFELLLGLRVVAGGFFPDPAQLLVDLAGEPIGIGAGAGNCQPR
jgi:hypothetical protein